MNGRPRLVAADLAVSHRVWVAAVIALLGEPWRWMRHLARLFAGGTSSVARSVGFAAAAVNLAMWDLSAIVRRSAKMQIIFIIVALSAGMASAFQSGSNQTLQKALGAPLWAAMIVAVVTAVTSMAVVLISGERLPAPGTASTPPWWAWAGGLLGVGFVLGTVYAAPKLGAGLFMASIVTAEVLTGLILDHFGLLGFDVHHAGWGRLTGGALMITGLSLIATF